MPRLKQYPEDLPGISLQDLWIDIRPLHNLSAERLCYPTQKPVQLLERIIQASTKEGDIILDPFCGCGTAVHAAQRLDRQWIGIDITHLAISLIEKRLNESFPKIKYKVEGTPKDLEGARDLALRNRDEFQWWACSLVGANPYQDKKKGADGGIDGLIFFDDSDIRKNKTGKIIVSIKSGKNITLAMLKDLIATVQNNKADFGLFVTLTKPTKPMVVEALKTGYYKAGNGKEYLKIQILTIEDLMSGLKKAEYPGLSNKQLTLKVSRKEILKPKSKQTKLDLRVNEPSKKKIAAQKTNSRTTKK